MYNSDLSRKLSARAKAIIDCNTVYPNELDQLL